MQIETLKVFCDLVESRSFSQAAFRNLITQSAVSQQIKNLESRFQTTFLARDGRAVSLTAAGKILYDASRDILDRFERMHTEIESIGEEMAGSIRVATIYSVGQSPERVTNTLSTSAISSTRTNTTRRS